MSAVTRQRRILVGDDEPEVTAIRAIGRRFRKGTTPPSKPYPRPTVKAT